MEALRHSRVEVMAARCPLLRCPLAIWGGLSIPSIRIAIKIWPDQRGRERVGEGERQAQILYEFEFTSAWPTLPPPRPCSHLRTCDSGFSAQVSGLVLPSIIRANEPATTRSRSREPGQQRSSA